jgi:hypothetical protein
MEETKAPPEQIMLLRHSNGDVNLLKKLGASIEGYTRVQPTFHKTYDYWCPGKPRISVVIVIAEDKVFGVYRVLGIEKEGSSYSLISEAHRQFEIKKGRRNGPVRCFNLVQLPSATRGIPITGWIGRTRTTVQRSNGGFFYEIEVDAPAVIPNYDLNRGWIEQNTLAEDIERIVSIKDIDATSKKTLVNARIGQGAFRADVLQVWGNRCVVTGSCVLDAIRASHIKPWRTSSDQERVDPNNGLPLTANLDALFDAGLISFEASGSMLVSSILTESEREIYGLTEKALAREPSRETAEYLAYHRNFVFRT